MADDWRIALPQLKTSGLALREVQQEDAGPLLALFSDREVASSISAPPASTSELVERIEAAHAERRLGRGVCLALVPDEERVAAGLFRVREIEPRFGSAEWEFAIAPGHWGRGTFFLAAPLVIDFVFDVLGASRLEARAAIGNGRGLAALRKLGAVQEAILRQAQQTPAGLRDQALWTILADTWRHKTGRLRVH